MIITCPSIEPGYYEDGQFGIRIEDIVQIVKADVKSDFGGRGALTFKTITMCPIQTKLIDASVLTDAEVFCSNVFSQYIHLLWTFLLYFQKTYLNNYHQQVRETLTPLLLRENDQFTVDWLAKETVSV